LPLLVLLALGLTAWGRIGVAVALCFCTYCAFLSYETATGTRAPRQGLREAAAFPDARRTEGEIVLVTPAGPTLLGLAYYTRPDTMIGGLPASAVPATVASVRAAGHGVWLAVQRLGPEPSFLDGVAGLPSESTHFVALDLVHVPR
jgi:hypothetical protein